MWRPRQIHILVCLLLACSMYGTHCGGDTPGIPPAPGNLVVATVTSTGLSISWDTVTNASSYNLYWSENQGVTVGSENKVENATNPYTHTALESGKTYYYIVTAVNSLGESAASDEVSGKPFIIVVYGDTRTFHDKHQEIADAINTFSPNAVFHTGDLVDDGRVADQWTTFNEITAELQATADFYPAAGNHENEAQLFYDNFDLPNNEKWYSVELFGIHFIVLNTNLDISVGSEQYQWLANDLASIESDIRHVMAVFHYPPFTTGPYYTDALGLREIIVPLFDEYNLDTAFSGHTHAYERSQYHNSFYVVTGAGGATPVNQRIDSIYSRIYLKSYNFCVMHEQSNRLTVDVYDEDLNKIDTFEVD